MTKETEDDVLGELYGWDAVIDDPKRDEDDALDAYEEMIQLASRPDDAKLLAGRPEDALGLAAQLLTKHFFKFPHVHLNVIDVMLALCGAQRPLAVRIHTIRSLIQIVKTPPSDKEPLASECTDRIQDVIAKLVAKEKSGVILRHMNELGKALKERREVVAQVLAAESKLKERRAVAEIAESKSAKKKSAKAEKLKKKADKVAEMEKEREAKKTMKQLLPTASTFSSALRALQEEAAVAQEQPSADRERHKQLRRTSSEDYVEKDTVKGLRDDRRSKDESAASVRRDSDERRTRIQELLAVPADQPRNSPTNAGGFNPQNCPPGPYLFIGNLPSDLRSSDIVAYLAEVDPSLTLQSVQVKYPNRLNTSGYAFVGLSTTQLAREAIRFVSNVKLHGRVMHANFARGPPCHILSFVERSGKGRSMEDVDAVRDFNFARCNRTVWERLCDELRTYGEFEEMEVGKVRFDSLEAAKEVIRNHHITIESYEIIPIYEPEEQLKNDSTRRYVQPQLSSSNAARQSFSLKSGRVVGDRDLSKESEVMPPSEPASEHRTEKLDQVTDGRSDKRDRKSDERKSRKRSPSPKKNERNDRKRSPGPKKDDEHKGRKRSSSPKPNERKSRERTPSPLKKKRESSSNNNYQQRHSRSRSASPVPMKPKQQKEQETRGRRSGSHSRSPSPIASSRKQSAAARGHSKSRSMSPVVSKRQSKPRAKHSPSRSISPPAPAPARKQKSRAARSTSRSASPVAFRKRDSRHRSKSPGPPPHAQNKKHELDYEGPMRTQNRADRSRPRSPIVAKERRSAPRRESPPALLPMPVDSRGPPERAQSRRKSRSRSGERERDRFVPRDMSSYGPSRREDGGKQQQHERERNLRDNNDHPFERKQHEREKSLRDNDQPRERSRLQPERRSSGAMSRYGPAAGSDIPTERPSNNNNHGGRDERRNDRQAPKRDYRDSPPQPPKQSILGDHVQGPPRTEQRRGSRSPPRNEQHRSSRSPPRFGGDRNRSNSPQSRRPLSDGPPQRASPGDNGGRGGREREQLRPLERKNSGSRRDDRSIAEVAREEQERIDRLQQQSRRDSHPSLGGNLSRYGDAGRGEHFGTPPPRDGGRPRGGSFQKPRSRSRSPLGRPMQPVQQRLNDFPRDRGHQSPLMPPHVRDLNRGLKNFPQFDHQHSRGNNMRDSPSFEHQRRGYNMRRDPPPLDLPKRERRESDGGRFERRGRSPPPSSLMAANDRRAPAPTVGAGEQRHRSRSKTRGRVDERERDQRKESRCSEKESRASNDQNNRNRANDQGKDRSKGRQQPDSPVLPTPPTGKRLRSRSRSPPSPVLRDNYRAKTGRARSRSPILKKSAAAHNDDDAPMFAEKRRRIDDDDDFVLPKPANSAVFDDMDEMMVDYEEDD